jgi:hypothetical protein
MERGARSQNPEFRRKAIKVPLFEPQNVEEGISNIEVITSSFCGSLFCCSIFTTLNDLSSVICHLVK